MNLKEAYVIMQKNCGIDVGDRVKVLREAESHAMGWDFPWLPTMNKHIGKIFTVIYVGANSGIKLNTSDNMPDNYMNYAFPFFALELIEKAPKTFNISLDGKSYELSEKSRDSLLKLLKDME